MAATALPGVGRPLSRQWSGAWGWNLAYAGFAALAVVVVLIGALNPPVLYPGDHFVHLARSFARGDLAVNSLAGGYADVVTVDGRTYLPLGPLPAVVYLPLLPLLDAGVPWQWGGPLVALLNVYLFRKVLRAAGVGVEASRWAVLLFFGGTVHLTATVVAGASWFGHLVTVSGLLLAILAHLRGRHPVLVGLLLGLAGAARLTALFALPFFAWRSTPGAAGRAALGLAIGLVPSMAALLAYNALRFGSPFETGYGLAVLSDPVLYEARSHGLFSLLHVPKNLFMLLLQGPVPYPSADAPVLEFPFVHFSPWGMGLFFTSPALLYAFRADWRGRFERACWLAIATLAVPVVSYYGVGLVQFGYRYALDFLPFLALLAARGLPDPLTRTARALVLASVGICAWGSLVLLVGLRPTP